MNLIEALRTLDSEEDAHWEDDQPSLDHLSELVGETVTEEALGELELDLTRPAPGTPLELPGPEPEQDEDDDRPDDQPAVQQPPFADATLENKVKEAEKVAEERAEVQAELDVALAEHEQSRLRVATLQGRLDKLILKQTDEGLPTHIKTQRDIQAYHQTQMEIRMKRAARRKKLLDALDGDTQGLDSRSEIDRAMARNTRRGGQRPAIPPKA